MLVYQRVGFNISERKSSARKKHVDRLLDGNSSRKSSKTEIGFAFARYPKPKKYQKVIIVSPYVP